MPRARTLALPAAALALILSGCADGGTASTGAAAPSAALSSTPSTQPSVAPAFNDTDVRFTQSMLPHHMQASRNATIELATGGDAKVKAIAQRILDTQTAEIAKMQGLLAEFGVSAGQPSPEQQAVWDANTADLKAAATPAERDVVFLTNMVPHHAAAIPMAQNEIDLGSYAPAKELARAIQTTQRREIKEMNALIRSRTS